MIISGASAAAVVVVVVVVVVVEVVVEVDLLLACLSPVLLILLEGRGSRPMPGSLGATVLVLDLGVVQTILLAISADADPAPEYSSVETSASSASAEESWAAVVLLLLGSLAGRLLRAGLLSDGKRGRVLFEPSEMIESSLSIYYLLENIKLY